MQKINKTEAEYLRSKGYEDFVKHTFSKHKTYYVVEDYKVLNCLKSFRKSNLIKSTEQEPERKKNYKKRTNEKK